MRIAAYLATISITILLSGCVAAVAGGAAAGGYYVGQDERTAGQIARDARITGSVKTALIREDDVKALNINVDTRNNHVLLHGHVASKAEEQLAIKVAEGVKGVESVTSKLSITPVDVEERG